MFMAKTKFTWNEFSRDRDKLIYTSETWHRLPQIYILNYLRDNRYSHAVF